jgi:hypothetical protein
MKNSCINISSALFGASLHFPCRRYLGSLEASKHSLA